MMRFDILTIFPEAFESYLNSSILGRAIKKRLITVKVHDLRRWTRDKHRSVDDRPYGGGPGMILKIEPVYRAVSSILRNSKFQNPNSKQFTKYKIQKTRIIIFSAKGKIMTQDDVRRLVKYKRLILICGHYEGVDERVAKYIADEELSIGEYVLTGGEIPALTVVDAVSRLLDGVLGKKTSLKEESFYKPGYREYPQYTRPEEFRGWKVPKVLLSGDHKKIAAWRAKHAGEPRPSPLRKFQNGVAE